MPFHKVLCLVAGCADCHHSSEHATSDSSGGWAPHWLTVSSCSSASSCCISVPEELENLATSQQAFNPVVQLSWGGCQPYVPRGPKAAESWLWPSSSSALQPHCKQPKSASHVPCCLLWLFPICSLHVMFLTWSRPSWAASLRSHH